MTAPLPPIKSCMILGADGFIGSAVQAESRHRGLSTLPITRENYDAHIGTPCDLLVNASGNSKKYLDARDPLRGFDRSVRSVLRTCLDFKPRHYVLLSSGALYPNEGDPARNCEDTALAAGAMTTDYGFHKWLAEQIVKRHAASYTILRLGGFVGPQLAKNAFYDVLKNLPLRVHPDSSYQVMDTRDMARLLFDIVARQPSAQETYNLSAVGTVSVREVADRCGRSLRETDLDLPRVRAELNIEKISQLVELPTAAETMQAFIAEFKTGEIELV